MNLALPFILAACCLVAEQPKADNRKVKNVTRCTLVFVESGNEPPTTDYFLTLNQSGSVTSLRGREVKDVALKQYLEAASKEYSPKPIEIDLNVGASVTTETLRQFTDRIIKHLPDGNSVNMRIRLVNDRTEDKP
jgi:hypothetical protein